MLLTKNFDTKEFACPCCGAARVSSKLIEMLQVAREEAGIPFTITSGFRCREHNMDVGGSNTSSHLRGLAADLACNGSSQRYLMLTALLKAGFSRIGVGSDFIHVDVDATKAVGVIWTY